MIIGINCCHLSDKTDGAKTRLTNFYSLLTKKKKNTKFIFFVPKNLSLKNFRKEFGTPNVFFHRINIYSHDIIKRFILGIFIWPLMFKKYNLDYFDQSYLPLFIFLKGKTKIILTIHDLRYLQFSTEFLYRYLIFKPVVKLGIFFCDILITVSQSIKNDLAEITKKKIIVISNFVNKKQHFSYQNKKLSYKYIFTIGHSEKRKNIDNLIKAFLYVKLGGYKGDLVICTNQGKEYLKIASIIKDHPFVENIRLLKNQSNQSVFQYYKHCDLFVLPSIYEGFGIPILEASLHKKVILLSSIPVFKEITFNQLEYFNPRSPKIISDKILATIKDKDKQIKLKKITQKVNVYYSSNRILDEFNKIFI